jgi:hypothetical protein
MIHAALHGKLGCLDLEDPLTAAVFGRLKYLPVQTVSDWFANARPWGTSSKPALAAFLEGAISPNPVFWPQWPDVLRGRGIVEPDVVLLSDSGMLVVEAKLDSGKSPSVVVIEEHEHPADQLARQWKAAGEVCRNRVYGALEPVALLYLTAHLSPPTRELDESIAAMRAHGAEPQLFWLSWSALEDPLRERIGQGAEPAAAIAKDVLAYLDEASLLRFKGWRLGQASPVKSAHLWRYARRAARPYWSQLGVKDQLWRYQPSKTYRFAGREPALPIWTYGKDVKHGK